jgi:hypothetical protein
MQQIAQILNTPSIMNQNVLAIVKLIKINAQILLTHNLILPIVHVFVVFQKIHAQLSLYQPGMNVNVIAFAHYLKNFALLTSQLSMKKFANALVIKIAIHVLAPHPTGLILNALAIVIQLPEVSFAPHYSTGISKPVHASIRFHLRVQSKVFQALGVYKLKIIKWGQLLTIGQILQKIIV